MTSAQLTSINSWPADALPKSSIDNLFAKLLAFYGSKFLDMWANTDIEEVKRIWALEIRKLSTEQMRVGYEQLATRKFPPTLPEFIELCKPAIDLTASYYEAVAGLQAREQGEIGTWSHPAVFWAASCMAYDLKNQTYSSIAKRWETALRAEMSKGQWSAVPAPMIALPAPGKSLSSKQQSSEMLKQLSATDVLKTANTRTDHKAWIKTVLKRAEKGDDRLPGISIRFAREAMAATEAK